MSYERACDREIMPIVRDFAASLALCGRLLTVIMALSTALPERLVRLHNGGAHEPNITRRNQAQTV